MICDWNHLNLRHLRTELPTHLCLLSVHFYTALKLTVLHLLYCEAFSANKSKLATLIKILLFFLTIYNVQQKLNDKISFQPAPSEDNQSKRKGSQLTPDSAKKAKIKPVDVDLENAPSDGMLVFTRFLKYQVVVFGTCECELLCKAC